MDIKVTLSENALVVSPDPAIVGVGAQVRWVYAGPHGRSYTWTVYFDHGTPFKTKATRFSSDASSANTIALVPEVAGDWKYGIAVRDSDTDEVLADDDPRLIVL